MKKLFTLFALMLALTSSTFVNAQSTQAVQSKSTSATKQVQHMKKDGTADKRFKENKAVKPVVIPVKKGGTPDMRYKASKKAVANPTVGP